MSDLKARKFDAAIKGFRQVIAADPNFADAHFQIARVMIAGDRSAGALKYLRRAVELQPGKLAYWQGWAEAVALGADEGQEKEFLTRLSKAPIDVPAKITIQDRFGVLRRSSRPKTGGLSSKNMGALVAAMTSKRFSEAEKMASAALKKYPQSAIAANILASAQSALGKTELALRSYQIAIRLDPKYAEAYNHLGRLLLEQNRLDEASEILKKSVILAPGLLPALVDLCDALVRINRHRAALPLLARAEKIDPKSVPVQVAIANANVRAHDAEKANAAFEKAIDLSATPLPANTLTAYAMTKSRLGDDQAAYAVLAEVLSETPDFAPALGGMGELLQ
ncbi:MAG: tetratricopeptide repeat protein, partial [Sulfitobacter sp.]